MVALAVVTLRVVTFVVERLEVPVTLRDPPKIETPLRVRILAVTRFPEAMLAVERLAVVALRVRILAVTRFPEAILAVERLAVVALRVRILVVVMTLMLEQSKLETAPFDAFRNAVFEVVVLRRLKKAVLAPSPPVMLAVVNQPVDILAVPETLRFTRTPSDVIFD